jgi:hypothetical protein
MKPVSEAQERINLLEKLIYRIGPKAVKALIAAPLAVVQTYARKHLPDAMAGQTECDHVAEQRDRLSRIQRGVQ